MSSITARSLLSPFDLHLFNEGTHSHLFEKLGAHPTHDPEGTYFAVWAPNADAVSVIGDFNNWDKGANGLYAREQSGIWEGFIPSVHHGAHYKYYVHSRATGNGVDKADPFATYSESPPRQASIVWDLAYDWGDEDWQRNRSNVNNVNAPWSVYEMHLGSWMRVPEDGNRWLTYRELAPRLADYVSRMGFNHGRNEVRGFLVSSALCGLQRYHVDGLRVDAVASMLYLDYSRKAGEWIPNKFGGRENLEAVDFLRRFNIEVYKEEPDVQTVAEESTAWPLVSRPTYVGGLGFGMKWDMGWMHDTLYYFQREPVHRKFHHANLTFRMLYAFGENFMLPLSHDEVVHGKGSLIAKMPGDEWQKFANNRLLFAWMYAQPGKKLLFMGGEFGQWREWDVEQSLDWHLLDQPNHGRLRLLVGDLNRILRGEKALYELDFHPAGFSWIDVADADNSVVSLIRRGRSPEDILVAAFNFTPVPRYNYQIGIPGPGRWLEILNSDAPLYGGSGQGNMGGVDAVPVALHGHMHSVTLTLPPLGAVFFKPEGSGASAPGRQADQDAG